jgi:predicted choloylglycine hydrolase
MRPEERFVVLEGTPIQRGHTYGETLRDLIQEGIRRWKENIRVAMEMDPDSYIADFVANTHYYRAIDEWTPDLLEEIKGIGESAGVDFNTIYAYQLVDEDWWYRGKKKAEMYEVPEHCSSFGVFGQEDQPTIIAQTMDIEGYTHGLQAVLHIKYPDAPLESLVFVKAGMVALNGVNNQSVAACTNTIAKEDHDIYGLPVAFVHRGLLEKTTFAEAVAFIKNVPHAAGQNYVIGGPQKVVDIEVSTGSIDEFIPYEGAKRVYHSNHPIINDHAAVYEKKLAQMSPERRKRMQQGWKNTIDRFNYLEGELRDETRVVDVERVKSILGRPPVCFVKESDKRSFTFGAEIMALGDRPELHVSFGPPSEYAYLTFGF